MEPSKVVSFGANWSQNGWDDGAKCLKTWWPGTELNRRRQPFQGWSHPKPSVDSNNPITGKTIEQFYREGDPIPPCPISLEQDRLLVAFTAPAELGTMLALWGRMSARVLDLDIEWKHINNDEYSMKDLKIEARNAKGEEELSPLGLLGVCAIHGISTRDQQHKEEMRRLILTAGPWTKEQERQILDYCTEDVSDTTALLAEMWVKIPDSFYCREKIDGIKAALHRGRSMPAFAWMEHIGIPIDVELNARLSKHFTAIMEDLYGEIREEFPIFNEGSFDIAPSKFTEFLKKKGWLDNKNHVVRYQASRSSAMKGGF